MLYFILSLFCTILAVVYGGDVDCQFSQDFCKWQVVSEVSTSSQSLTWQIGTRSTGSYTTFAQTRLVDSGGLSSSSSNQQSRAAVRRRINSNNTTTATTTSQPPDEESRKKRDAADSRGFPLAASLISSTSPPPPSTRARSYCLSFWYHVGSTPGNGVLNVYKSSDGSITDYDAWPLLSTDDSDADGLWHQANVEVKPKTTFRLKIKASSAAINNVVKLAAVRLRSGRCYRTPNGTSDVLKPVASGEATDRGLLVAVWPNKKIPYQIDQSNGGFSSDDSSTLNRAIDTINRQTCVQFVRRGIEADYVLFTRVAGESCQATVGYLGGQQDAFVGNSCIKNFGETLHMLMHVIGFQHEHQRSDRDSFVTINFGNVQDQGADQFAIDYSALKFGQYDYTSVTQFGPYAYASDTSQKTITPTSESPKSQLMGQRYGLSFGDISAVNQAYSCSNNLRTTCSPPCSNGGSCQGPNFCVCQTGFSGQSCENSGSSAGGNGNDNGGDNWANNNDNNDCRNGGTKRSNVCSCPNGYFGQKCESPRCSPICLNNGTCVAPNKCQCVSGFTGKNCQYGSNDCVSDSDCSGGRGTCDSGRCQCSAGWAGRFCQNSACAQTCPGATICVGQNQCRCRGGRSNPPNCDVSTDPSDTPIDCKDRPCQNGGKCVGLNTCQCPTGWAGDSCNRPYCDPLCPLIKQCVGGNACICKATGYTGDNCTIPICDPPCNSKSQCISPGVCQCSTGWTGSQCEIPVCGGGCGSAGQCTAPGVCTCNPGFNGFGCSTPVCEGGCGINAVCTAPNVCQCNPGWTGNQCSNPSCNPACVNGFCSAPNQCSCSAGYGGATCSIVTSPTISLGGQCSESAQCIGDYTYCRLLSASCSQGICACQSGYTSINGKCALPARVGDRCDSPNLACTENSQCSADGTCQCVSGFKRGPLQKCTSPTSTKIYGDACSSSEECYYDLICRGGACTCAPGTTKDSDYSCRSNKYNDACNSTADCGNLERAVCTGGTCQCATGYTLQSFKTEGGDNIVTTCASGSALKKGSACSQGHENVCDINYACIQCYGSGSTPSCLYPGNNPEPKPQTSVIVAGAMSWYRPTLVTTFIAILAGIQNCILF